MSRILFYLDQNEQLRQDRLDPVTLLNERRVKFFKWIIKEVRNKITYDE